MISATPLYRLGDAWTGNATDEHGVDWVVTEEDGWSSSPPVRPTREDRQGGDGAWSGPGFYSARVITLSGSAVAPNRAAMLRAKDRLKAAINARRLVRLTVEEEHLSRYADVRLSDQIDLTDRGSVAFNWTLIVAASDPRRYSSTPVTRDTGLPAASGAGRTYPRTFPYTYGGSGGSGSLYFTNEGDYECPAVFTINGPVINPQIAHIQTGRSVAFLLELTAGQTLVVDLATRTALLNGSASRGGSIVPGSAWFLLQPGSNELQFRGQRGAGDIEPTLVMTAASAWT